MKILATLLMLLFSALSLTASPIPGFPHLSARGYSHKGVAPDSATITFTVIDFQEKSEDAVSNINATLRTLVEGLQKLGIEDTDITANDLEKSVTRERGSDGYKNLKILGYFVQRTASVQISNIESYPAIAQLIFKTDLIRNINSRFESSKGEEIRLSLLKEACDEAKEKAEVMAKAAGVEIDRVYAVSPDGEEYHFDSSNRSFALSSGSVLPSLEDNTSLPPLFVPAKINIDTSVTVLFRLVERK